MTLRRPRCASSPKSRPLRTTRLSPDVPKTVLYLTPSVRLLGARRSLLGLAASLDPSRWKPVVCGQSEGDLQEALRERGIPFEKLKLGWWRKGKYILLRPIAIARLAALIRRVGADLVHCNEIYPNPYAVRACRRAAGARGHPIPVITHMRLTITPRMIRNYDLRRAAMIVVPSEAAGHDFDLWPDRAERVRVVYNGVDLKEFSRSQSRADARRRIGVPNGGMLLAAIGQLGPRKGSDVIIKAMARLAAGAPALKLMFVGNPHGGQEEFARGVRAQAGASGLEGRVFFFPYTRDILPYYEAADVNLLISREEGFGRTIIEAAALGVPSIGARTGGIPELILDGRTGLLVRSEDDAALAEAIGRLLAGSDALGSMGDAARCHVERNFSIRAHTDRIMELYDSL